MGEYKPLIFGLIFLFLIGGLLSVMITPFMNIDEELEDSDKQWINPFVTIGGSFIDFLSLPFRVVIGTYEGITGFFGFGETAYFDFHLIVNGTGTDNNLTLDGRYYAGISANVYVNENNINHKIYIERDSEDEIINITLESSEYTFWWFTHKLIYYADEDLEDPTTTLNLYATELDFNSEAVLSFYAPEGFEEIKTLGSQVNTFFDELKEQTEDSIKPIGLIPQIVGLPLMLILLISIIYGIIKLLPISI